jgi:pimeloyl-ACP methyl ester carboxylesterase
VTLRAATTPTLEVAYEESGPAAGPPVVLLHGFPYDVRAYADVASALAADGCRAIVPYLRGYGPTRFRRAETMRSGQQGALAADLLELLDALGLEGPIVAGHDWGGRAATIVAALWPERVGGLVGIAATYNVHDVAAAGEPADPEDEARFWYQWYLHGERGRAGLERHRRELARLLWRQWSPTWTFDDATFEATAPSFDNPDFVDVVVHSYRVRFGLVAGDPAYDEIEARLVERPRVEVPTVILLGGDDGVSPADARSAPPAGRYGDLRGFAVVPGAGHNLPQERPQPVVDAVRSLLG